MTSPPKHQTLEGRFVSFLLKLKQQDDRGALAALRRGLGCAPGEAAEMHRYVVPFLQPDRDGDDWRFYLVASLFATHPETWAGESQGRWTSNLGASFRRLSQLRGGTPGTQAPAVERRFTALLGARQEDLPDHLRHAISLLKAEGVPVDYAQILEDLRWWDHEERRVQRRWARAFWADSATREGDANAQDANDDGQPDDDGNE